MHFIKIINNFFNNNIINKFSKNAITTKQQNDNLTTSSSHSNNSTKYFNNPQNCNINFKNQQENSSFINTDSNFKNSHEYQKTDYSTHNSKNKFIPFVTTTKDSSIQEISQIEKGFSNIILQSNEIQKDEFIFLESNNSKSNRSFEVLDTNYNNAIKIESNTFNIYPRTSTQPSNTSKKNIELIKNDKQITKEEAATKINAHVKGFLTRIKFKTPNPYGFKEFKYTQKNNLKNSTPFTQEFLISSNGYTFVKPQIESYINNGENGTFKKIIAKDNHSVLFKLLRSCNSQATLTSNEIETILDQHNINTYKVTHRISDKMAIAKNAGQKNIKDYIANNLITINDFKNILIDTKKLHTYGYYHLDLKSSNIQVKEKSVQGVTTKTLSVIDLDSFSHFMKTPEMAGTPYYTTYDLTKRCFPKGCIENSLDTIIPPTKEALQIFDEYALAISILESVKIKIERPIQYMQPFKRAWLGNITITEAIDKFINENIKEEFKNMFKLLITDPIKYIEYLTQNNQNSIYLADMFTFT